MKFNVAVILLSLHATSAFMSGERLNRVSVMQRSMAVDKEVDLSIPYDAAARLAYDEWRQQFNKGAFDEKRFVSFKANYEAVTVANVVAKKEARESGSDEPLALMTLNEYGDFTEEEFSRLSSGSGSATGKVLEKALEVAQSQSEASSALEEAANALAAEEEVGILYKFVGDLTNGMF
jgi:hypothetical protein